MPRSAATVSRRPLAGQFVDLQASAGSLPDDAWVRARNVSYRDDNTPERRPGFYSYHPRLDIAGGVLATESPAPTELPVKGLFEFMRYRNTGRFPVRMFIANAGDYLLGSQYGQAFDIPLAKGIGVNHAPDFTAFFRDADLKNYLVVMSTNPNFPPSYWSGGAARWDSASAEKWGYLKPIPGLPSGRFSTLHNGRLFVASQDGSTIFYSVAGDLLDFVSVGAGSFAVDPNFGRCTGFFDTFYGELLIGQEGAIQRGQFTDGVLTALAPVTTEVGLMNNRCTAQIGQDQVYMGSKGKLQSIATTDRFGDLVQGELTQSVTRRFDVPSRSAWDAAFVVDDPTEQILWIGHAQGSGTKNDTLTGWDYRHQRFVYAENESIGGMACGGVFTDGRFQRPKAFFGSYSIATQDPGSHGTAGRVWTFNPLHKEDVFFASSSEAVDATGPLHLAPLVNIPRNGGMNVTAAEISAAGTYQDSAAYRAMVKVRVLTGGTVGAGSVTLDLHDRGAGQLGTILQNVGAAYTGTPFNVETATYDSGFDMQLPVGRVLTKGQEIQLVASSGRRITEVFQSDLRDLSEGLQVCEKGGTFAYNFVPILESAGAYFGDPHESMHLEGVTVVTRVTGNRADILTADDDDHAGQNQYRWAIDMYFRADEDKDWAQLAIIDGNAAKRAHLSVSQSEAAGAYAERPSLVHALSPDGTEASGTPMGRKTDINLEYVPIDRFVKVFWVRFGQETAMSLDHTNAGGENILESMRLADFNIVALHFHITPGQSEVGMSQGSTTIRFNLPAVA